MSRNIRCYQSTAWCAYYFVTTYVVLATRRGKWVALSQIIGFVYTWHLIAYTGSHSTVSPHVSSQFRLRGVKCERRVRYSCTLPFDTLFSRATLVPLAKNLLHERIFILSFPACYFLPENAKRMSGRLVMSR